MANPSWLYCYCYFVRKPFPDHPDWGAVPHHSPVWRSGHAWLCCGEKQLQFFIESKQQKLLFLLTYIFQVRPRQRFSLVTFYVIDSSVSCLMMPPCQCALTWLPHQREKELQRSFSVSITLPLHSLYQPELVTGSCIISRGWRSTTNIYSEVRENQVSITNV